MFSKMSQFEWSQCWVFLWLKIHPNSNCEHLYLIWSKVYSLYTFLTWTTTNQAKTMLWGSLLQSYATRIIDHECSQLAPRTTKIVGLKSKQFHLQQILTKLFYCVWFVQTKQPFAANQSNPKPNSSWNSYTSMNAELLVGVQLTVIQRVCKIRITVWAL